MKDIQIKFKFKLLQQVVMTPTTNIFYFSFFIFFPIK